MSYYIILYIIATVILFATANRLRGTGMLFNIATLKNLNKYTFNKIDQINIKFVGNHVYALLMSLLIVVLLYKSNTVEDLIYAGIAAIVFYIVGESKGWGEWVGSLTIQDNKKNWVWLQKQYIDDEGKSFPFIFSIANFFIKEKMHRSENMILGDIHLDRAIDQYIRHATLALILRGMFWWLMAYMPFVMLGIINMYEYISIVLFLGLVFPIACYLGKKTNIKGRLLFFNYSQGWENQELYYGAFNGLVVTYLFLIKLNII